MANPSEIAARDYYSEFTFVTSRSSGPGGQHVNKLETRVTLRFKPVNSQILSDEEKTKLLEKWESKLTNEGFYVVHSEKHRTQLLNKQEVVAKFRKALVMAFTVPKLRKATKPSKGSIRRRLDGKKKLSDKKNNRKPPDLD